MSLRPLDPSRFVEELKEFSVFLGAGLDIAHFACHGRYRNENASLSQIQLSNDFCISLKDMEAYNILNPDHPLVIMNACETGNINPSYTSYFARFFIARGARGVVATECGIPDQTSGTVRRRLYIDLLAGEPLGKEFVEFKALLRKRATEPFCLALRSLRPPPIRLLEAKSG